MREKPHRRSLRRKDANLALLKWWAMTSLSKRVGSMILNALPLAVQCDISLNSVIDRTLMSFKGNDCMLEMLSFIAGDFLVSGFVVQ